MLTPYKHTDIKYSVLYISGLIIRELKQSGIVKYEDLKNVIIHQTGKEIGNTFEYALSFLYLINEISYNQKSDTITI